MGDRLADAAHRIDAIEAGARVVRKDTRVRVERRVNALRAQEADARSRVRAGIEAAGPWDGAIGELNWELELERDLDEMDIDVSIAQAQLELDSADDRASFEAGVRRQIDAYRAYAELLEGRARHGSDGSEGVLDQWDGDADSIRHRTAATAQRLERYRELSNEVSHSLKASVLAALDDLDRAAARARSTRGGSPNGRGATWE